MIFTLQLMLEGGKTVLARGLWIQQTYLFNYEVYVF